MTKQDYTLNELTTPLIVAGLVSLALVLMNIYA